MFGLGKDRSKLGKWMDQRGVKQEWLAKKAGVGRNTVGDLAAGGEEKRSPTSRTMKKLLKALRTIDPNIKSEDFWDM